MHQVARVGVSASASVLPVNIQDCSVGWTSWISLQSKGLSESFSSLWRLAIGGPLWLILLGCSARQALRQPPCLGLGCSVCQAHTGAPLTGVLLWWSVRKALKGLPHLGSFSVVGALGV